jgi:hypothetical protein
MPAIRRNAMRAMLVLAIALCVSTPVRADDVLSDPAGGPRKLLNHVECAVAVGIADLGHYATLAAAIFACVRAFIDEPNWLPGGN